MKKIYFLLLFITAAANAQIVNFADTNFKSVLLQDATINTNNDSDIQVSEALAVINLDVSLNPIVDLTGIEAFQNLEELNCSFTTLTSLNASMLPNLKVLNCSNSQIVNLNLNGLVHLKELIASSNLIQNLNLNGLLALESLLISDNPIATLNLTGLLSLTYLQASQTDMTTLAISDLPLLNNLIVNNNQLLVALTLNNVSQLKDISCGGNPLLDTLTVTGANIIEHIGCSENNLTAIDTSNLPELLSLYCGSNNITSLDFTNNPKLRVLNCPDTLLTTIDISGNNQFCMLECNSNPFLTSIFMKNGPGATDCSEFGDFSNNPSLQYVCTNEEDVLAMANYFGNLGMNVNVNTYCTFEPGGNYNTIYGNVNFDSDNNGCDATDIVFDNLKLTLSDGTQSFASFTNQGNYNFFAQTGNYTITPAIENNNFFVINPTSTAFNFPTLNNNIQQDFCIIPNGSHQDLEIVLAPVVPARPGFDAIYKIVYKNKGNQIMALDYGVTLFYNQNLMLFVSADIAPDTNGPGALSWNYTNLKPFETRVILVTLHINAPTDLINPVNIGDVLTFTTSISPIGSDENQFDNYGTLDQTVVGSFDPNDIQCLQGEVLAPSEIGKFLHYVIRFENTGTAAAENIVVAIQIDPNEFDIPTLQLLNASHSVDARLIGNKIEFIFKNIMLDSGGHGNILLKVKSKGDLTIGDSVTKKANVYFDYNFPVLTNEVSTAFQTLGTHETADSSIVVYPNPAENTIYVKSDNPISSVQLFDVQGRLLQTKMIKENNADLNISDRTKGIYFLKIISEKGVKIEKIVKR